MIREEIKKLIEKSIKCLQKEGKLPDFEIPEISVENPKEKTHGDYATGVALQIAKMVKKKPEETANLLNSKFQIPAPKGRGSLNKVERLDSKFFSKIEVAKPGFINFFVSGEYLQKQVGEILKQKEKFGSLKIGKNQKINVEFISANPTGPLTLGNGRGGFCGDVLANILGKTGYKVTREYYANDSGAGGQIKKLGHSVLGDKEAVYKGDYILDLRKRIKEKDPGQVGERAAEIILEEMIKPSVKKMGIKFDVWFSEKKLYSKKEIEKTLQFLKNKNLIYESGGAVWFKSTQFGDDKDRVVIKTDGSYTYFAPDIAYLKNKIKRKFSQLIMFLGADHYGYTGRYIAAAEALGFKKENVHLIIMQLVRLLKEGQEVRMSKRTGTYVTIEELIDETSVDVARFFFLTRSPNTHLNFDLDLAKEQSEKNPVYYIQYAYARISSILRKAQNNFQFPISNFQLLIHPSELELIKQLIRFPEIIEDIAKDYQVQRLPNYALELVTAFHKFYEDCRVISDDRNLTQARLALVGATKIVLKNTLDLMGISAPPKM